MCLNGARPPARGAGSIQARLSNVSKKAAGFLSVNDAPNGARVAREH